MPKKLPGLIRRGNTYGVRFRVPTDIVETYNKVEVTKTLGTTDESEARRRYFDTVKSINADFDKHRAELGLSPLAAVAAAVKAEPLKLRLTAAARRKACNDHYARRLDEERLHRHTLLKAAKADPDVFWQDAIRSDLARDRLTFWNDAIADGKVSIEGTLYHIIAYNDDARRKTLERAHLIGDCTEFIPFTDADLEEDDRVKLALDLMAVELRVLNALQIPSEYVQPDQTEAAPAPVAAVATVTPAQPASDAPSFTVALKKWLNQNNGKRWTPERKISCEGILLDFCELAGERQIDEYTAAHGRTFKDALTVLPSSWRKRKNLRGLSLKDVIAKAPGLGYGVQGAETINKKLTIASQFFRWCRTEYADFGVVNPLEGFKVERNTGANEEVDPFSIEQINAIFQTPPFVGAKSDHFWQQTGPYVLRDSEKFWLPLLALFTGMRLNEPCQLSRQHIREYEGVHYIALTRELRLKKNPGMPQSPGIRNVPIHQTLIDCGFLEFVATRPGRLFPSIPMHSSGRYSDAPSKWFQRLLAAFEIKTPKTKFHSFRHNFIAAAKRCRVEMEARERIVGHVLPGESSRYGDDFVTEQTDMELMLYRNDELQKISYPGLMIDHLKL